MSREVPPRRAVARRATALIAAFGMVATALVGGGAAQAAPSPSAPVIINEVYGGGGNSGATYTRDFIELYNPTDEPISLVGWSVQYASSAGTVYQVTPLTGTIAAGGYFLVTEAAGAGGSIELEGDVVGTIPMSATSGKVALVSGVTPLTCGNACSAAPEVIDYVGFGTAALDYAGSGPAPTLSNTTSASRDAAHTNTADNAADFTAGTPTPQGADDDGEEEEPPGPTVRTIAEIQGTGAASPFAGSTVTTRGIVTAAYPTGGLNGYVIQTPGTGGAIDLATHTASDALFVFSSSTVGAVSIGDHVEVTGTVSEFFGLTELTVSSMAGLTILDEPAAPIEPALLPWPATDAERETLESMLLAPQGSYTVSNTFSTNQYGEVGLAFGDEPLRQPTDVAAPGTPEAAAVAADNAARAVVLDDGATTNFLSAANQSLTPAYVSLVEPVVVGATATFLAPVIVDYRNNAWKLNPTTPIIGDGSGDDIIAFSNPRTAAPEDVGGDLTIASFNVLNYFTTLGYENASCQPYRDRTGDPVTVNTGCPQRGAWDPDDFLRQQDKIVRAINTLDADIVGLLEIENSAALGEEADEAIATLVDALNAAAGTEKWAYVHSSPELPDVSLQDVITNAIIYQPAKATPSGPARALGTASEAGQAFQNAREPIAQAFRPAGGGERLLFVVNHFKSKGSAGPWPGDADTGDGQGASNESRVRQAAALRDWVEQIRGSITSVALAGDFNSYGQEDPLRVLYDAGYVDAEHALGVDTSSYSFSGLSGSLDHILLSQAALQRATGADIWNINSGEAIALEYSRYNYHGTLFYAPDVYRSSDHDPVLVGLRAGTDERTATATALSTRPPVHINHAVAAMLTAKVTANGKAVADGHVEFREGDVVIGVAPVSKGTANFTLPRNLTVGTHSYVAVFVPAAPDALRPSTSNAVDVRVIH